MNLLEPLQGKIDLQKDRIDIVAIVKDPDGTLSNEPVIINSVNRRTLLVGASIIGLAAALLSAMGRGHLAAFFWGVALLTIASALFSHRHEIHISREKVVFRFGRDAVTCPWLLFVCDRSVVPRILNRVEASCGIPIDRARLNEVTALRGSRLVGRGTKVAVSELGSKRLWFEGDMLVLAGKHELRNSEIGLILRAIASSLGGGRSEAVAPIGMPPEAETRGASSEGAEDPSLKDLGGGYLVKLNDIRLPRACCVCLTSTSCSPVELTSQSGHGFWLGALAGVSVEARLLFFLCSRCQGEQLRVARRAFASFVVLFVSTFGSSALLLLNGRPLGLLGLLPVAFAIRYFILRRHVLPIRVRLPSTYFLLRNRRRLGLGSLRQAQRFLESRVVLEFANKAYEKTFVRQYRG